MMSQTEQQMITMYILPKMSRSKGNNAVKCGRLKNLMRDIFFFRNHAESRIGRLVTDINCSTP